ncbi:MAG TPA: tripartite tricarboxylate transporter TctB family protein [Beijerinckiaceae bacterium]|nr:tripartite tricarboxylate transporter TctB family protein [Beijerinckiaceae bacterium]
MRANDAIAGLILILFAGAMIAITFTFPAFPGQRYGPNLFPRVVGAGIIICGLILVWRGLQMRSAGEPWGALAPWTREPRRAVSFGLILGSILLYIFASDAVGFIPLVAGTLIVLFLWFRVRPLVAVPVALAATLIVHWFFASAMRVPLPRGLLDPIL